MPMKGDHRTLVGQSLLSEATSGDLVVEAYPSPSLTDNAVAIAHFDYLNKQNSSSYYAEARSSLFFGPRSARCNCEILPRSADQDYPTNETLALN
jgi:hypothetical protein